MKLSDLYSEYIANWLTSGTLVLRDKLSSLGIKAGFDRILTKKSVTKVWFIKYIPVNFEENLGELIREELFILCPEAKTTLMYYSLPVSPSINGDMFKRQMAGAEDRLESLKELFSEMSETDKIAGKTFRTGKGRLTVKKSDIKKLKDRFDSYSYVHKHKSSGGEFFNTYLFIQASGETNEIVNKYRKDLAGVLQGREIIFSEVKGDIYQYLSNFGPASYIQKKDIFGSVLLSDENLSYISPYRSRGLVGGFGTLFGVDWLTKLPLILNFRETSAAQVIVYIAKSGKGKTFAAQMAAMGFLADKDYHVSVVDLKGNEWNKLINFKTPLEIRLGGSEGAGVNTLRLDDLDVKKEDAIFIYQMAISATVGLFSLATNLSPMEGNQTDLEMICRNCVMKYYGRISGFKESAPKTFHLTKEMTYENLLTVIEEFSHSSSLSESQKRVARLVVSRVSVLFGPRGEFRITKDKEISLGRVINHDYVIYSLDKNVDRSMSLLDDIKVYMCGHLNRKKHYMRSVSGLFTVDIYEEGQRVKQVGSKSKEGGHSSELLSMISSTVTGSRSDNVNVMLLLNSISAFDDPEFDQIASNITTSIVGAVNSEDIPKICKKFNCEDLQEYIHAVSEEGTSSMKNTFAIKFDNGEKVYKTIYKVVIPESSAEELRQRDVVISPSQEETTNLIPIR